MRCIERLTRILSRTEGETRPEEFTLDQQLAMGLYHANSKMSDWQLFMRMVLAQEEFTPNSMEEAVSVIASLQDRGFLIGHQEQGYESQIVRELTPDGRKAANLIARAKGVYRQPIVINLPVSQLTICGKQ